jgi:hypothetical protein
MNLHLSTEQLSDYLDSELGFAVAHQLESHCSWCAECAARLESMRRVVAGLGRAGRAVPPPALRQQIRRQVLAEPPVYGVRKALGTLRFLLFPLQPRLRTAAAMGLALVVGLFTFSHQEGSFLRSGGRAAGPGQEVVTVETGAQGGQVVPTTSEVAGREFLWTDDGWIQKGLVGQTPVARVDTGSPQGRALLTKFSDLEFLLADGSPVVLRYNLETVEIRNAAPTRVLGYEGRPAQRPPLVRVRRGRTVAA